MSKPINEPRLVQQALISDEDLSFELAALVPTANGITNAASTFIDRATKLLLSDKIMLTNEQHTAVTSAIAVAQLTVKEGCGRVEAAQPGHFGGHHRRTATHLQGQAGCPINVFGCRVAGHAGRSASPPDWTRRSPAATGTRTRPSIRRRGIPPTPKSS